MCNAGAEFDAENENALYKVYSLHYNLILYAILTKRVNCMHAIPFLNA